MIPISEVVKVQTDVFAGGVAQGEFGRGLHLTKDATLAGGGAGKVQAYSTVKALNAAFASGSEPRKSGAAWFAQDPFPQPLLIGRWNQAVVKTTITGGTPKAVTDIEAVTAGSIDIGGIEKTGIDFDTDTSYADVAASLQTGLRAGSSAGDLLNDVAVAYANGRFTITLEDSDAISENGGLPQDASSGTSILELLGLRAEDGAVYKQGGPNEASNITDALDAIRRVEDNWYFLFLDAEQSGQQTMVDVAAWAQSNGKFFVAHSQEAQALVSNDSTSKMAEILATEASRVICVYSAFRDYLAASVAAKLSSVDFDSLDSAITLNLQQMPTISPSDITQSQKDELDRKGGNYYIRFGNSPRFANGITADSGVWADVRHFLDWLNNRVQNEVFNLLASGKRIPATSAGTAQLVDAVNQVLELGVRSGHLAPGKVSETLANEIRRNTGNARFDGYLTNGYLAYATPIAEQAKADRDARKAPPIKVWAKGSSAFHDADIAITYEE